MATPRARVIIDNDFSGDPDDLFQLAHHVLSPSVQIPFIVGSHLSAHDGFDPSDRQAENAARIARELLATMGLADQLPVIQGSNMGLSDPLTPIASSAAKAIVAEAMRDDTDLPLYVALGAGLTELASALLLEPRIADRLTAVWIGGNEHEGLAEAPPGGMPIEYNLFIDPIAGQTVFNHSSVPIWQVPRDAYRQCMVSHAELDARVRPMGEVGKYMMEALDRVLMSAAANAGNMGETYVLGDSPLVLLTALQSAWEPDTPSCSFVTMPTPHLSANGSYEENPDGRPLRIYTRIDTRLMFEDFFLKLAAFAGARAS